MSSLFHHYKELKECISEVEQIEGKVNISSNKNKEELMTKKEEEQEEKQQEEEASAATLDGYWNRR